jgi:phosphoribosylaminoimidazole-succinocarboxamide synthase
MQITDGEGGRSFVSLNAASNSERAGLIPELTFLRSGKVRDLYQVDEDRILIVASDRISAFDCVLPNEIPRKGEVLTQLSSFWFNRFRGIVENHLITAEFEQFPEELRRITSLSGRSMLVRRADVIPFECVVRGYLAGSGWKDYRQTGSICGHRLPDGLVESDRLPDPIFTPATKAEEGHDLNLTIDQMSAALGDELTKNLEAISLRLYREAAEYAWQRGIIISDTKFEFGLREENLVLIDEILTPDSSRFWTRSTYSPGKPQFSFDKQYVRDFLETLAWDKRPPAPPLPQDVVTATSEKYLEAYRLITGSELR